MARIVEFASYGAPEVLEFKDVPDPQPAAGEVRIRVKAIGLNRAESMWRHGEYIETANLPARLGYEAAGTVDALGEGVAGFEIGEPANVIPNFSMSQYRPMASRSSCRSARSSSSRPRSPSWRVHRSG
jgi:NADPH:quinone reductase-like Zn-dependent oxidoreductase